MRAKIKINPSDVLRIMDKADVQSVLPRLRGNKFVDSRGYVDSIAHRKEQEIPRAIAVNRKYIGAIKSLAESGEIPKKDASRMIRAIRYQNTRDAMPLLSRAIRNSRKSIENERFVYVHPFGYKEFYPNDNSRKRPRPNQRRTYTLIGEAKGDETKHPMYTETTWSNEYGSWPRTRELVNPHYKPEGTKVVYGKRRGDVYRMKHRFNGPVGYLGQDSEKIGDATRFRPDEMQDIKERMKNFNIVEVPNKYKTKKPSAERMIQDTKRKLKISALHDLNDAYLPPFKRKPRNRSEKIVEQMANKYRDMRNMVKLPNGEIVDMRLVLPKKQFSDTNVNVYSVKLTPDDIIL